MPALGLPVPRLLRLTYTDGREETVRAGQAYYAPAGHRFEALEDCETVEFSPTHELEETFAVVGPNVEAAMNAARESRGSHAGR